ncbi:MAG: hypothetical protein JWQ81_7985 [Amycolatopsis sp.]|uniref:choice-of-anchor D domain-containing protein n=1 Tax=Amycolatopsis sp. TaxID=37632 RepID=UPI00261A3B37|nr:choice-of-anchor D domain-containing protein [Amycolatopsis sp.]MCU1687246.1 hypothetical protein [Amycolatopsis sp.]
MVLSTAAANADDPTSGYNSLRTGWDPSEAGLAPSQVTSTDFGPLFKTQLNGQIYAQPIVANGVVVASTETNDAYGLDPVTGVVKWHQNFGTPWQASTVNCGDLAPTVGSTATSVYNPANNAVYFTSKSIDAGATADTPTWRLHALDVKTGVELNGFPTTIKGSPTNNPGVPFIPKTAMQRPGLLLLDGVVYAGFASHCDFTPYVGYILGVNGSTGKQTTLWSTESDPAGEAGIWQSGAGLLSDGPGRIIVATGNGISPAPGPGNTPPATLGESVVRLNVEADGSLTAKSFFSPANRDGLNQDDMDLGSGGPMAIPPEFGTAAHPRMIVQVGKDGKIFLLDADNLGGAGQGPGGTDAVLGTVDGTQGVWGRPGFWGGDGGYVYTVHNGAPLRALKYSSAGATPSLTPAGGSKDNFGYTSGSPVITSTGTTSGSALVWVVYASNNIGDNAQLRAYDPVPVNGVLTLRYSVPIPSHASKFSVPGTDAGRIYVGNRDGILYGFGRPTTAVLTTQPVDFGSTPVGTTKNGTITVTANRDLTLNSVSVAAPFTATLAAPTALVKGQQLSVPATFTPATWGSATATVTFSTGNGDAALDVVGSGTQPGLGSSPSSLDFGRVATGAAKQLGVTISNTGTTPVTITGATGPTGSFTAKSLPDTGTVIQPGASLPIPVKYAPTVGSEAGIPESGTLSLTSDQGNVSVALNGVALTGHAQLTIDPPVLDFGTVPVGQSVTKTFTLSNTGTISLRISKAPPPVGVFHTDLPLDEGTELQPDATYTQKVTFTPTSVMPATSTYPFTPNDGTGVHSVTLTGNANPVGDYYNKLGGSANPDLLSPLTAVYDTPGGGKAQDYVRGAIYWTPTTGAHAVHGDIYKDYKALGGPGGPLGYPTTDETGTPDGIGRYNHFNRSDGASIYDSPATGAHAIYGAIRSKWASMGWEQSPLGYPTTDEMITPDGVGRYNHFGRPDGGSIYYTPTTGPHAIYGVIRSKWASMGWETGPLGYPTTDEMTTPDGVGRYNHFSRSDGASLYYTPSTGAHAIYGSIRAKWASLGWEQGRLGYPSSDEYGVTGGRRNDFVHGTMTFNSSNGSITITYK